MQAVPLKLPERKFAKYLAMIGTLIAMVMHISFGVYAGALWRDEVNTLEIAGMQSIHEMWHYLPFDSFPVLYFAFLRATGVMLDYSSDLHLRASGVLIGILILCSLWLNARSLRFAFPLISLALISLNPLVIRYADSIRAYGLGMFLILLSFATMWRLVEKVTPGRLAAALVSAVLSVQCLYHNSFILFAICIAGAAVCLRKRNYKVIPIILAIGFVSALSLLIYLPVIAQVQSTNYFWRVEFTADLFWKKLSETFAAPHEYGMWIWLALLILAAAAAAISFIKQRQTAVSLADFDLILYGSTAFLAGVLAYCGFLFHLSYLTQPWYYIVLLAFVAVTLESIIATLPRQWIVRSIITIIIIGMSLQPAWDALQLRQTNVDKIASYLNSEAKEGDLVLVNTWNYGISFQRYYDGKATVTTIPPVSDLRMHRMDLIHHQIRSNDPMSGVLETMFETLGAGRTVWLVGSLHFLPKDQKPVQWRSGEPGYYRAWSEQAAYLLQTHASVFMRIPLRSAQQVMHYENLSLFAFRSGQESDPPQTRQ
jgi:hypothetical protein